MADLTLPEQSPLFQSLDEGELSFLSERLRLQRFPPGAALLEMGQAGPGLYVIRSGSAAVVITDAAGSRREIANLVKGECLGELALLTGEPCSAGVIASEPLEAWFIERGEFIDVIERCPGLWRNLVRILSQRLARTTRQLAAGTARNVVALVVACPEDEETGLALAITGSLAAQTGRRVLLVDARAQPLRPAVALAPQARAPALAELLRERSLLQKHSEPQSRGNGLSGARVATVAIEGGEVEDAACQQGLEWLAPLYDHILLLLSGPPAPPRPTLLGIARSIVTVVSEDDLARVVPWLSQLRENGSVQRVDAALVAFGEPRPASLAALQKGTGGHVVGISRDAEALQRILRQGGVADGSAAPLHRDLGRLARRVAGATIGIALGAGAAKGLAHIGVLRVLEQANIPIDYIAGSSIGAIVGALYASGSYSPDAIQELLEGGDRKIRRWTLPRRSLWSDSGLRRILSDPGPTVEFHQLATPFVAVATDLASGREVILREGLVWRAVQASVSIPGIFPPLLVAGRYLVDGGVVSPVPTEAARAMGADIVLAVDLSSPSLRPEGPPPITVGSTRERGAPPPSIIEMLWRATEIMQTEITSRNAATADVTIAPSVGRSRFSDFSRRPKEFVKAGEEAARAALPDLQRFLPWINASPQSGGSP